MPHTIKNSFYKHLTFENLLSAHLRAKKQKAKKCEVLRFELNLENNLVNLLNKLKNGTYHVGNYRIFYINEPKLRKIEALPYVDRIVHQWYVEEFIKPNIVPKFINSSCACIVGRGCHKAADIIQHDMKVYKRKNPNYWILKCDIRKFFYSIDPNILFSIVKKYMSGKKLIQFTHQLIFENRKDPIGIPIGNYTSQFFANIYLNELDQYIKHTLRVKYYVRYMDDFVMLLEDKETCKTYKKLIEEFVENKLHLSLNQKSRYYPAAQGLNFCGYRIWPTHRLLRKSSKTKIKRKIRKWNKIWLRGDLDFGIVMPSLQSWLAHANHCNTYKLKCKVLNSAEFLYNDKKEYPVRID